MFLLLYCQCENYLFKVRSHQFSSDYPSIYVPQHHTSLSTFQNENMEIIFIFFFSPQPIEEIDC